MKASIRPRPSDFRSTYIEVGKDGCIAHYRAHWKTVDRWVEEEGKDGIRKARADYVREARRRGSDKPIVSARIDPVQCDADELSAACQYLRERQGGSWRVGLRDDGCYFVGTATLVGSEVIERAKAKGMDEFYVERDILARMLLSEGNDEWVLERESER